LLGCGKRIAAVVQVRVAVGVLVGLLTLATNVRAQDVFVPEASSIEFDVRTPVERAVPPYWRLLAFSASKPRAELQAEILDVDGEFTWVPVCKGACLAAVVPGTDYRVGGRGVSSSRVFTIEQSRSVMYVRARPGSSAARTVGIVMIPVGALVLAVGLSLIMLSTAACQDCTDQERKDSLNEGLKGGLPAVLAGSAAIAVGIGLIVSQRTRVDISTAGSTSPPRLRLGRSLEIAPDGFRF
jgi:hypothetical protein